MTDKNDKPITVTEWLGFKRRPNLAAHRTMGGVVGLLVILLVAATVLPAIVATVGLLWNVMLNPSETASFRTGALIAAILGAPFIIWRTMVAAKQAAVQEEALFNDKINAAAEGLAARRQVTKALAPGGSYKLHQDFWEDDLVTRASAIDRLEGLAKERPDTAARVARMLSIYVRELSREYPAKEPPKGATPQELRDWAAKLTPIRPDMEKAAQSLGRLLRIDGHDIASADMDLRQANLQGFDLATLNFANARFDGAEMQGANLEGAEMQGAYLRGAKMQGADLWGAKMQGANLWGAKMQGADLRGAEMQGADLRGAKMQRADLTRAKMQGADLWGAKMDENTDLTAATLRGAAVRSMDGTTIAQLRPFWAAIFADGSVQLPEDEERPAQWEEQELGSGDFRTRWRAWQDSLPDFDPSWRQG